MASTLPTFGSEYPQEYDVDADAALVQCGIYKKPTFYSDASRSSGHMSFMSGVNAALSFAGQAMRKFDLVSKQDSTTGFRLTEDEYMLLQKRARSISNYAKIPYDTCEDFLIILCFVDNITDMRKIADAVQISELDDEKILQKPMIILNIPKLEKICFAAQALDGLVNMFRKYIQGSQATVNESNDSDDMGSILGAISSLIGGFGGASLGPRMETGEMGNFLSELISGKRIPMNVIAKNPMLQSPSYVGKTFFGENPNPVSNVDMDQLFNKAIALFPEMQAGAGTSSFSMQNFGSFSQAMPLVNTVAKLITGSSSTGSERKQNQVNAVVEKVNNLIGTKSDDVVEINRADNAIPLMMAVSTTLSGFEKCVFSAKTFQQGWVNSQSVSNIMMNTDPGFMEAARRFL